MYEVRWLNIEYIFFKIYDFIGSVFGGGSASDPFGQSSTITRGGMGGFFGSGKSFGMWLGDLFQGTISFVWVLATIALFILFMLVVYIRLRVKELDDQDTEKYTGHFVKPAPLEIFAKNPRWERIEQLFDSHNQNDWRIAIIEADTMLDELLVSYNFPGENLGERLKNANTRVLPTIQSAWEAHKVRNRIAHEGMNFTLSQKEAEVTKKHFEFVFRDAGVI